MAVKDIFLLSLAISTSLRILAHSSTTAPSRTRRNDSITNHFENPSISDHTKNQFENRSSNDHTTNNFENPSISDHTKNQFENRSSNDHTTNNFENPSISDHTKNQFENRSSNDHTTNNFENPSISDHTKNQFENRSSNDHTTNNFENPSISDHTKNQFENRSSNDHTTNNFENPSISDHTKNQFENRSSNDHTTNNFENPSISDHTKNQFENRSSNDHTTNNFENPSISDHTNNQFENRSSNDHATNNFENRSNNDHTNNYFEKQSSNPHTNYYFENRSFNDDTTNYFENHSTHDHTTNHFENRSLSSKGYFLNLLLFTNSISSREGNGSSTAERRTTLETNVANREAALSKTSQNIVNAKNLSETENIAKVDVSSETNESSYNVWPSSETTKNNITFFASSETTKNNITFFASSETTKNIVTVDVSSETTKNIVTVDVSSETTKNIATVDVSSETTKNIATVNVSSETTKNIVTVDVSSETTKNIATVDASSETTETIATVGPSYETTESVFNVWPSSENIATVGASPESTENIATVDVSSKTTESSVNVWPSSKTTENIATVDASSESTENIATTASPKTTKNNVNFWSSSGTTENIATVGASSKTTENIANVWPLFETTGNRVRAVAVSKTTENSVTTSSQSYSNKEITTGSHEIAENIYEAPDLIENTENSAGAIGLLEIIENSGRPVARPQYKISPNKLASGTSEKSKWSYPLTLTTHLGPQLLEKIPGQSQHTTKHESGRHLNNKSENVTGKSTTKKYKNEKVIDNIKLFNQAELIKSVEITAIFGGNRNEKLGQKKYMSHGKGGFGFNQETPTTPVHHANTGQPGVSIEESIVMVVCWYVGDLSEQAVPQEEPTICGNSQSNNNKESKESVCCTTGKMRLAGIFDKQNRKRGRDREDQMDATGCQCEICPAWLSIKDRCLFALGYFWTLSNDWSSDHQPELDYLGELTECCLVELPVSFPNWSDHNCLNVFQKWSDNNSSVVFQNWSDHNSLEVFQNWLDELRKCQIPALNVYYFRAPLNCCMNELNISSRTNQCCKNALSTEVKKHTCCFLLNEPEDEDNTASCNCEFPDHLSTSKPITDTIKHSGFASDRHLKLTLHHLLVSEYKESSDDKDDPIYNNAAPFATCEPTQTSPDTCKPTETDPKSCEPTKTSPQILMVRLCPEETDNSLKNKCENSSQPLLPPVTVSLPQGDLTFRNIFCANCHGFLRPSLLFWPTSLICENISTDLTMLTTLDFANYVHSGNCSLTFNVPEEIINPAHCTPNQSQWHNFVGGASSGECRPKYPDECELKHSFFKFLKLIFPKIKCNSCDRHCRIFNPPVCEKTVDIQFNLDRELTAYDAPHGGIVIIIDFSGKNNQQVHLCRDDDFLDPYTLDCLHLICPPWSVPFRGKCYNVRKKYFMKNSTQIFPNKWSKLTAIWSAPITQVEFWCRCLNVIASNWSNVIDNIQINGSRFGEQNENNYSLCNPDNSELNITGYLSFTISIKATETGLITSRILMNFWNFITGVENITSEILISNFINSKPPGNCSNNRSPKKVEEFYYEEVKGIEYAVVNFSQVRIYYPLKTVGYELVFNISSTSASFHESVYVCETSQLFFRNSCDVLTFNLNETTQNGSQLKVLPTGRRYDEGSFEIQEDQAFVCEKLERDAKTQSHDWTYVVISFVFTIISVIFLFLMLVIYCALPELRTLPGKMTASLAATMMLTFIFNLFSLVKLRHDYVCPIVAAVSHVVTLAHFGWMSAIAVSMALTFRTGAKLLPKNNIGDTIFFRYNLVVWGLSLAIVGASVTLDLTHDDLPPTPDTPLPTDMDESDSENPSFNNYLPKFSLYYHSTTFSPNYPRYGIPVCIWFSGPLWTQLVFIIIPYFITFIVNITGFILTLVGLKRSHKVSEKVGRKSSERAQCLIYLKLSTAMGFSWIMSILVGVFPNCVTLVYMYVCLVLVQGVLLFCAFMLNRRVYALIKNRFTSNKKTDSLNLTAKCGIMTGSTRKA